MRPYRMQRRPPLDSDSDTLIREVFQAHPDPGVDLKHAVGIIYFILIGKVLSTCLALEYELGI